MQLSLPPPPAPRHDQVQGPEPEIFDAWPLSHKLAFGASVDASPLAVPQAPLTVGTFTGATQATARPPFEPEQAHVQGPEPLTALGVPDWHKSSSGASLAEMVAALPQAASTLLDAIAAAAAFGAAQVLVTQKSCKLPSVQLAERLALDLAGEGVGITGLVAAFFPFLDMFVTGGRGCCFLGAGGLGI